MEGEATLFFVYHFSPFSIKWACGETRIEETRTGPSHFFYPQVISRRKGWTPGKPEVVPTNSLLDALFNNHSFQVDLKRPIMPVSEALINQQLQKDCFCFRGSFEYFSKMTPGIERIHSGVQCSHQSWSHSLITVGAISPQCAAALFRKFVYSRCSAQAPADPSRCTEQIRRKKVRHRMVQRISSRLKRNVLTHSAWFSALWKREQNRGVDAETHTELHPQGEGERTQAFMLHVF